MATTAITSDDEFIRLFKQYGPEALARKLKVHRRKIYERRNHLEAKLGTVISNRQGRRKGSHSEEVIVTSHQPPGRLHDTVTDGVVLIGSDAHYWTGPPSTAHRAFVEFVKEYKPAAVIMNGDAMDGSAISRHAPIMWEDRPTVQQELEVVGERLGEIGKASKNSRLFWTLGNHDCLDQETECLTRRGWLRYTEIEPSDLVLSLDGSEAVWSPINQILSGPFDGELVRVEKTRFSMAVTPNHRVLLNRINWRTKDYDIREYRFASDLPSSFNIPMSGQVNAPGVSMANDQIALAGWILTDGCMENHGISIFQSKAPGRAEIERILNNLGLKYSVYIRQRGRRAICGRALLADPLESAQYRIAVESAREVWKWLPAKGSLPDWAFDMNAEQFQVFLDALVAGDGVWDGFDPSAKTCCVLYGEKEFLDSVQAAAVTHGWRARVSADNRGDYRLCLTKISKLRIERGEITHEAYKGDVWCLRVPHGNFMVRRSGCAYFTGNSRYESRLATVAPEYARVHGVHLKDHFPRWLPCWSVWLNNSVVVKHRWKNGIHAPHNNTVQSGQSIVTGHLHSLKVSPWTDYTGTRYGVDCGTMADPWGDQFQYIEDSPRNWRSGFVLLTFRNGRLMWPEVVHVLEEGKVEFRGEIISV